MLLDRSVERNRAGPEVTFAALWSEAPCTLDEVQRRTLGDPRVVARLFRKLKGQKNSVLKKRKLRPQQHLLRPHLEEET